MKKVKGEKSGGFCCDHCSDSKFPCVLMEKQMKGEPRRRRVADEPFEDTEKKEPSDG